LRLPAGGSDELGIAMNAFNHMLGEIEKRGATLLSVNRQLQQQAELAKAAQAQAESASMAKTRFLANMSHELRSPLNGVIGAAQLLQAQGADSARRRELVEIIRTSGSNLLGLIEHVLDLARIEAGVLELQPQDFNLLDCVEAAVQSSAPVAMAKGLRLSCCVDPHMALWRHGDDVRLRQLVLNLLGNAAKFTARGDVSVDVRPSGGHQDRLQIQIRDTGIGVAPEALATIFEPFQQADASTTRRFGGSGLGLAICRDLARLMGGDVTAQSIPGVGSCFTLELPLPQAQRPGDETEALGLRVAWCEPHEPSAQALSALLVRLGCQSQRCHDLSELQAFMMVNDSWGRLPWFIVALDSELGRALLRGALHRLEPTRVLPIDGPADAQQAHARDSLGLPRAMARPLLRSALVSRLASARGTDLPTQPAPLSPAAGGAAAQVLLVEDDPINQAVVQSMLEYAGFACTVAGNGTSALHHLAHSRFDLVLMDWQMPDMDGLEATRRLRRGDAGDINRTVPVVALTANAFAEDRSACLAAGMNDFVTKPVLAAHLVAVAERWAFRHRVPDGEALRADSVTARAAPIDGAPDYDPGVLARLPMVADGSNPQYTHRLLGLFERTVTQTLSAIERGMDAADLTAVQRSLHSLKSGAGQVGALALAAEAGRAETAMRRGELDAAALPPMLKRLRAAHRRFTEAVAVTDPNTSRSGSGRS
jgi:two-component system sensor histidine kinase BarA